MKEPEFKLRDLIGLPFLAISVFFMWLNCLIGGEYTAYKMVELMKKGIIPTNERKQNEKNKKAVSQRIKIYTDSDRREELIWIRQGRMGDFASSGENHRAYKDSVKVIK